MAQLSTGPVILGMPAVRPLANSGPDQPSGVSTNVRPGTHALVDRYRRTARDLRVSLTDRCNLRCQYCMPADGLDWAPISTMLSDSEVVRLIKIAVERAGVRKIRFTGGEPLLRKGLERIITATTALRTDEGEPPEVSLTTNGLGLQHRAAGLAQAGLTRVNVSLDSIDRVTYAAVTRRDRLDDVLSGLAAAAAAGIAPIKLNAVLLRGQNEEEVPDLLAFALQHGYELRFIEQMPLGPSEAWERDQFIDAAEILARLRKRYRLEPTDATDRGSAPAERWVVRDARGRRLGTVGVIAAISDNFCGACDRTRLTADGQLRTCLFARSEHDLRNPLRAGATDEQLAQIWRNAHWNKLAGHGIDEPGFLQPDRPMSAIGG